MNNVETCLLLGPVSARRINKQCLLFCFVLYANLQPAALFYLLKTHRTINAFGTDSLNCELFGRTTSS